MFINIIILIFISFFFTDIICLWEFLSLSLILKYSSSIFFLFIDQYYHIKTDVINVFQLILLSLFCFSFLNTVIFGMLFIHLCCILLPFYLQVLFLNLKKKIILKDHRWIIPMAFKDISHGYAAVLIASTPCFVLQMAWYRE